MKLTSVFVAASLLVSAAVGAPLPRAEQGGGLEKRLGPLIPFLAPLAEAGLEVGADYAIDKAFEKRSVPRLTAQQIADLVKLLNFPAFATGKLAADIAADAKQDAGMQKRLVPLLVELGEALVETGAEVAPDIANGEVQKL